MSAAFESYENSPLCVHNLSEKFLQETGGGNRGVLAVIMMVSEPQASNQDIQVPRDEE